MFEPWVGEEYASQKVFPRTLILGESHYGNHHVTYNYDLKRKTILCIEDQIIHNCPYRFFTRLVSALTGKRPTLDEKRTFWHRVAYHNLIDEPLEASRRAPTAEQWERSIATLPQILADLKPEFCLVLGYRMWHKLHWRFDFQKMAVAGEIGPCGAVESPSMKCVFQGMKHPSGRGFVNAQWSGWVENLIRENWANRSFRTDASSSRR